MDVIIEPFRGASNRGLHVRLTEIAARAKVPRPALINIIRSFIAYEQRQFGTEGSYSGGWAPLADSTVASKAAHGFDSHILQASDRLKKSLTTTGGVDSGISIVDDRVLHLGTSVTYAVFHMRGTRKMPARPPIAIPPEARLRWRQILQRYIVHGKLTPVEP